MESGLTIAFVCLGKTHSTIESYKKFGDKYWDDALNNKSKIGYYFAYYYQQKYVYIHKIINILQPKERPKDMEWESTKQILCLSKKLKEFTWHEWITGIGFGAPFTPKYRQSNTNSWSYNEFQINYKMFNFINFKNIVENQTNHIDPPLMVKKDFDERSEHELESEVENSEDENEIISKHKDVINDYIKTQEAETLRILKEKKAKKMRKHIDQLREKRKANIKTEITKIMNEIKSLQTKVLNLNKFLESVDTGMHDDELIKEETDNMTSSILL